MALPAADPGKQELLDVGGCSGDIAIKLCPACPGLAATVFDLPQVTGFAARKTAAGLSRPDANIRLLRPGDGY
jgi:precorrin-6B methylase 2